MSATTVTPLNSNNNGIRNKLVDKIAEQTRIAQEAAKEKEQIAYLRDVHLALLLSRVNQQNLDPLFTCGVYVSTSGDIHIALRGIQLGKGWKAKTKFVSSTSGKTLELTSPVEILMSVSENGFVYQLPSLSDLHGDWDINLWLEFDPAYTVPDYIRVPISVQLPSLHIDVLDSALQPQHASTLSATLSPNMLCICEVWIENSKDSENLANSLLEKLLFDSISPYSERCTANIMISQTCAEFVVPAIAEPVTVTCIPDTRTSHVALRVRSMSSKAFVPVVYAVAKRLEILLSLENMSQRALNELQYKYSQLVPINAYVDHVILKLNSVV